LAGRSADRSSFIDRVHDRGSGSNDGSFSNKSDDIMVAARLIARCRDTPRVLLTRTIRARGDIDPTSPRIV
jgi:hypothetical protein